VDVEKGDDVAFFDRVAVDVTQLSARLLDHTDGDVARDNRERNVEPAMVQVDVGSADLRVQRAKERRISFERGRREFVNPKWHIRRRHDSS
jgi:hypothetical protein